MKLTSTSSSPSASVMLPLPSRPMLSSNRAACLRLSSADLGSCLAPSWRTPSSWPPPSGRRAPGYTGNVLFSQQTYIATRRGNRLLTAIMIVMTANLRLCAAKRQCSSTDLKRGWRPSRIAALICRVDREMSLGTGALCPAGPRWAASLLRARPCIHDPLPTASCSIGACHASSHARWSGFTRQGQT